MDSRVCASATPGYPRAEAYVEGNQRTHAWQSSERIAMIRVKHLGINRFCFGLNAYGSPELNFGGAQHVVCD